MFPRYVTYGSTEFSVLIITGIIIGLAAILIPLYLIWQLNLPILIKLILQAIYLFVVYILKSKGS